MFLATIVLYMLGASILLGILEYYRDVSRIRSCAKYFRALPIKRVLAIAIVLFSLLLLVGHLSESISVSTRISLIVSVLLLTGSLTFMEYRALVSYRFTIGHKKVIGILVGIFVLFTSVGINILVDSELSRLTGLASTELPNAQRLNFLLLSALFISIAVFLVLMVAYFLQAAFVLFNMIRSASYVDGVYGAVSVILGIKRIEKSDETTAAALFLGLMISVVSLNLALQQVFSKDWLSDRVRDYLLFSSYQDIPKYCVNLDATTSKVAFLRGGKVSIASFKDDGKVSFQPGFCIRAEPANQKAQKSTTIG
jgi:hypothetical protein